MQHKVATQYNAMILLYVRNVVGVTTSVAGNTSGRSEEYDC